MARKSMLGTTFGGNYLACACALAVLDIIEDEGLMANALACGDYLLDSLSSCHPERSDCHPEPSSCHPERSEGSPAITSIRGRGLMIGIEFNGPIAELRRKLLYERHIFTGVAGTNIVRLLPPLCLTKEDCDYFLSNFAELTEI
jgi:acetylornithine aminotransferase